MSTSEVKAQARKLMSEWEAGGSRGFWMDFYESQSGFSIGTEEYALVNEMTLRGRL